MVAEQIFKGCVYAQVENTHKIESPYIHHEIKLFALTDRVKEDTSAKKGVKSTEILTNIHRFVK